MHINFGISRFSRKGMDTTTKDAEKREIGTTTSAQLKCRGSSIAMREAIGNKHEVAQRTWPVFWL